MGLAVLRFGNNFLDKYQSKHPSESPNPLLIIVVIMNMSQALKIVIPPPVFSLLTFIGTIIFVYVCIIAFSIMLSLLVIALFYVVCEFVWAPLYERRNRDPEAGDERLSFQPNREEWHDQATFYQAAVLHNLRVLEILDSIVEALEERRDQRHQRDREQLLEIKLPPPIAYGSHEIEMNCKDCVICMEDFETDQLCQQLLEFGEAPTTLVAGQQSLVVRASFDVTQVRRWRSKHFVYALFSRGGHLAVLECDVKGFNCGFARDLCLK
ncbi:unnamed protein product [Prunus armeniaca]|uniref:Uncharacterized protein n=1 Tax=Prunus armeniaca TaxID=36596 RepID=A0A6J5X4Y6_PRUAR|nr:unnamed protein product [Prunus armeniaca]